MTRTDNEGRKKDEKGASKQGGKGRTRKRQGRDKATRRGLERERTRTQQWKGGRSACVWRA